MSKRPKARHVVLKRRSPPVFLPHDRTLREHVEETRVHQDAWSPTTTPVPVAPDRQAPSTIRCRRFRDLIEVALPTHPQLTA